MIHLIYQRLNRHRAVHQADAGGGGVAVHAGVGQRGILIAAEFQDGVAHLKKNQIIGNYSELLTKICISLHRQKQDIDV